MICTMLMRSALRQQKDCLTSQNKLETKEEDINMKSYNIQNYIRYKTDLEKTIARIKIKEHYSLYDRDTLVTLFMPLVENIAKKFATYQQEPYIEICVKN